MTETVTQIQLEIVLFCYVADERECLVGAAPRLRHGQYSELFHISGIF